MRKLLSIILILCMLPAFALGEETERGGRGTVEIIDEEIEGEYEDEFYGEDDVVVYDPSEELELDDVTIDNSLNTLSNVKNILLLGVDSRSKKGFAGRTDTMMLMSVDIESHTIRLVSFMRDMYVEIPGNKNNRLNSAYVFGGDVDTDQDEPRFAGALSFTPMGDETVTLTVAGISDIGECGMVDDINDALVVKDEETGEECEGTYDGAPGIDASLVVKLESIGVTLAMEYLAAVDDIELNGEKSQPQAWSADLAYTIFDRLTLASRYEGAEDFEFDWRAGVAAEYAVNDHLAFSLEYLYGEPNDDEEDEEHLVTAQMAVTF